MSAIAAELLIAWSAFGGREGWWATDASRPDWRAPVWGPAIHAGAEEIDEDIRWDWRNEALRGYPLRVDFSGTDCGTPGCSLCSKQPPAPAAEKGACG